MLSGENVFNHNFYKNINALFLCYYAGMQAKQNELLR